MHLCSAATLTGCDIDDASQIGPLLDQAAVPVASFTADGAYDQDRIYDEVAARHPGAAVVVPPRASAVPSDTAGTAPTQRDHRPRDCRGVRAPILDRSAVPRGAQLLRGIDPFVLQTSTKAGTLDMLFNAGRWHDAVAQLAMEKGTAVFGSSANRSLTGSKYRLEDIEPEVRAAAAMAINGGTARYANPEGKSSTIINFRSFRLIRRGVCRDMLETIFRERFGIVLPD